MKIATILGLVVGMRMDNPHVEGQAVYTIQIMPENGRRTMDVAVTRDVYQKLQKHLFNTDALSVSKPKQLKISIELE